MKKPCLSSGCPQIVSSGSYCERHRKARQVIRDQQRGSAADRGYGGGWQSLSKRIIARDRGICHWCGGKATTTDHVIPKAHGGSDDPDNLVASCLPCNSSRGGQTRAVSIG